VDSSRSKCQAGRGLTRRDALALAALGLTAGMPGISQAAGPSGQLTWAAHVSLAPTWFDPAETSGIITPFMVLYALHDAKPCRILDGRRGWAELRIRPA